MKRYILFILVSLSFTVQAQQKQKLYLQSYDAGSFDKIVVNSSYGNIYLQPSVEVIGARVEFIFSDDIGGKALKIMKHIDIIDTVINRTLTLTTKFDESLFLKNNQLWEIKDDINIEYRVKVPPHAIVTINQKHGSVFTGSISNSIHVNLNNAGLYSKFTDKLTVTGSEFLIDASGVDALTVSGSHGYLVLANTKTANLSLSFSSIESIGFEELTADFDNVSLSAGRTGSLELFAERSTIEFTNIIQRADCQLTDVRFVIQKLPEQFSLRNIRGSAIFGLDSKRHVRANLMAENSELEVRLKRGTLRMDYESKKTLITVPAGGLLKKKLVEIVQSDSHGIVISAQLKRGQFLFKK